MNLGHALGFIASNNFDEKVRACSGFFVHISRVIQYPHMEGFKPSFGAEHPENKIERLDDWRSLRAEAPKKAAEILIERGLQSDVAQATEEEANALRQELPRLIDEYSYNEDGSVKNENRYVVEALARVLHAAHKRREYEEALTNAR
jgi:hypothetical protein